MNKNLKNEISSALLGEELEKFENALAKLDIVMHDGCGEFRNFNEVLKDLSSLWNTNMRAIKIGNWKILFVNGKFSGFFKYRGAACGEMTQIDEVAWKAVPFKQKLAYILG